MNNETIDTSLDNLTLPDALKLTDEQKQVKAYTIGTISIDANGCFHVHYVGHQKVFRKEYFGNGVESGYNPVTLLYRIASRLLKKKDVYLNKIKEVEDASKQQDETAA